MYSLKDIIEKDRERAKGLLERVKPFVGGMGFELASDLQIALKKYENLIDWYEDQMDKAQLRAMADTIKSSAPEETEDDLIG